MKKVLLFLLLIFSFALILRLHALDTMPSGFHKDEVMSAYFGRFILENGKDMYGNIFPLLYVDKFGDFPPVIPMYFSGLSTYLFGFTVFATRFPVALMGALTIFLFYFLAKEIWKDKRIALFSALLVAILPWHIVLSRATAEGIIALASAMAGLIFLFKCLKSQKKHFFLLSLGFFLLTYLLYPSYRLVIPLLLLPVPFLFSFKKSFKLLVFGGIFVAFLLTAGIASTDWGKGRFEQTSLASATGVTLVQKKIEILAQEEGQNHVREVKTFHNKYIVYAQEFIIQYVSYFSPSYFFLSGGLPYRYSVANQGVLYFIMAPLLLLALLFLRERQPRIGLYLLYLLFISPLPAAMTIDDVPNVHRTMFMIVPFVLLAAFGFVSAVDFLKKTKFKLPFILVIFSVLLVEFIFFLHMYYHHANSVKSFERGDTNKEAIWSIIEEKKHYSKIYAFNFDVFPIYYLFFTHNVDKSLIGKVEDRLVIKQLDNITFFPFDCPSYELRQQKLSKDTLIIDRIECNLNLEYSTIKEFTRTDGTKSYRFLVPNVK